MLHSNNAARIRLWMALKKPGGMGDMIETRVLTYPDLQTAEFKAVNPLKKVPALIRADGTTVFESNVILSYLEDKYFDAGPSMKPATPEGRQIMELFCRMHDLYIASPNCTAPGFSHSQGAMYLSTGWHGPARGMELPTRAAKLREIWRQLCWLEMEVAEVAGDGPYMLGSSPSLADFTWFPTCVFMEFMLPRVFGWPQLFEPGLRTPFPHLANWYTAMRDIEAFAATREDIWGYWVKLEAQGQFEPILAELAANSDPCLKFKYGFGHKVTLNYQEPPPPGKFTGRYINQPDAGDASDEVVGVVDVIRDARELWPAPTLDSMGFTLAEWPTQCKDFRDDEEVVGAYYAEIMALIKETSGADRVFVFDHTIRESGNTNLNAEVGGSAAPVPRVHCDYTATGAPKRLQQLGKAGIHSRIRGRVLSEDEVAQLAAGRFAFINVWRSIDPEHPVMQKPLAVADENSVPDCDKFLYELRFPDRTGENYSLKHSAEHMWYYYPRQTMDECLVFKVYDKKEDGPRFVFHTAIDDPLTPANPPPRKSIEVRTIAFFDPPPIEGADDITAAAVESEGWVGRD